MYLIEVVRVTRGSRLSIKVFTLNRLEAGVHVAGEPPSRWQRTIAVSSP
ncbi:MAG: hypothetical protein ACOH1U_07815 [Rhodoglobus sp.]